MFKFKNNQCNWCEKKNKELDKHGLCDDCKDVSTEKILNGEEELPNELHW